MTPTTILKYPKATGGYLFLEYNTASGIFVTGDSNATDHQFSPYCVEVQVKRKRDLEDTIQRLQSYGFQNFRNGKNRNFAGE